MYGAVLADDVAAPLEATVALLDAFALHHVVAASAAQRRAVVDGAAAAVALAATGARQVEAGVSLAKVGRLLVVEQLGRQVALASVLAAAIFDALASPTTFGLAVPRSATAFEAFLLDQQRQAVAQIRLVDHDGLAKTLLEGVAYEPEFGRRFPTSFQLAAARHAVTFAAYLHLSGNRLLNQIQSTYVD